MAKKKSKKKTSKRVNNIPRESTPTEDRLQLVKMNHPDLYTRARKKVGLTDEQIANYYDAESLKKALDRMSPGTNADAIVKAVVPPQVKEAPKTGERPDMIEVVSQLETGFIMPNRLQYDENNFAAELRGINRKYGAKEPVKIVKTINLKPVAGKNVYHQNCKFLVTTYKIFYTTKYSINSSLI